MAWTKLRRVYWADSTAMSAATARGSHGFCKPAYFVEEGLHVCPVGTLV
jgi:hypothetical protein